jgi:hypothetical protein
VLEIVNGPEWENPNGAVTHTVFKLSGGAYAVID